TFQDGGVFINTATECGRNGCGSGTESTYRD
ncbi:hypothetical protein LSAT2_003153, partial [Lamellibrachia satsuma]